MKCPKCNCDINDKILVCPNCKKVLKLVCPKCNTVNKSNVCKKCGFTIIAKCYKCGKINQTIKGTCSKCGFNNYTSVAINSSNIDEFACLTVEFPNLDDIQSALGSTKLIDKFKHNLDRLILNYTNSVGVTREIIENIYIVRFNKDSSFQESANNALKAAIEIQNAITELNFKLNKMINTHLRCNIAVLKRDIYSRPENYKSGFDINLIYQQTQKYSLLSNLQIIIDSHIYEKVCEKYDLSLLTSKFIKNEVLTFFELNLKKYIKIPKPKEEEEVSEIKKLNIFDEEVIEEEENNLYDVDGITFDELKCTFTKSSSINLITDILDVFNTNPKRVISIKGKKEFFPRTEEILEQLETSNLFENVFRVTCHEGMKYKPYGFFNELISGIYNYSLTPKNFGANNFEIFETIDSSGFVKDLINLNERTFPHPEDVRYSIFDILFNIFQAMSKSLIYIENFEQIDDTSRELLKLFFEKFDEWNISYLLISNEDFSLHKDSHFLLINPNYIEIIIKQAPFKEIPKKNMRKYKGILDSYYMQKIAQNTKGSILYFENAIDYLLEKGFLSIEKNILSIDNFENILIPPTLDELIAKRLKFLSNNKEAYKTFAMFLLIGSRIDLLTINLFDISDEAKILKLLIDKKYIYVYKNSIYIQNYNLYFENMISNINSELKKSFAQELLEKVFATPIKHPAEILLYKILEKAKQEFITLEQLSHLNASMGDFSAYLNCSIKFLKLLDNYVNEDSEKTIEEYKMEVYENISNLLYKYTPNEIHNITQIILNNLEETTNDKKIIDLCNKMLQGCLIGGNYSYALELLHKILSRFLNYSINPQDNNFNISFFLFSLVKIEILFSIGNLKDCIEAGEEILNVITPKNIKDLRPENLSLTQFEEVILDAMSFVIISKIILPEGNLQEFMEKVKTNTGKSPIVFDLFLMLQKLIKGEKPQLNDNMQIADDKFSNILVNIIKAFSETENNYEKFASHIHQAKINAKMHNLSQIELICDLLIGYSYFKLNKIKKASVICYNVLETSTQNGLKLITYLTWYLISVLKLENNDIDVALGIANNAIIQLEKDYNSSDLIFFLFKFILYQILTAKGETESAELCLQNALFIKEKYNLVTLSR